MGTPLMQIWDSEQGKYTPVPAIIGPTGPTGPAGSDASVTAANIAAALGYTPIGASDLLDAIYPVGSIYQSVNSTSPATLFGGTWERIEDKFLLAAGDIYAVGTTGGEATHTLTVSEMPKHNHGNYIEIASNASNKYISGGSAYGDLYRSTASTGGGQPHNNMPPYQAVYVWQRTA